MELPIFGWWSIGKKHIIATTYNIFDASGLNRGALYSSIGTNGTIGTNGIGTNIHCF